MQNKILLMLKNRTYFSKQHGIVYIATPKAACTSIKWGLASLLGYDEAIKQNKDSVETAPELAVHDVFPKVAPHVCRLSPDTLRDVLTAQEYFRFALVRNPYTRVFSAWQSKLLLGEPSHSHPYKNCAFYNTDIKNKKDVTESFEMFLSYIKTHEAPNILNNHWKPQNDIIFQDIIKYSLIAQIEQLDNLKKKLVNYITETGVQTLFSYRHNESLIPYHPEFFSDASISIINDIYYDDFNIFAYKKELPAAKENFSEDAMQVAGTAVKMIRGRHTHLGYLKDKHNELYLAAGFLTKKIEQLRQKTP